MNDMETLALVFTVVLVVEFVVFVLLLIPEVSAAFEQMFETLAEILSRPLLWAIAIFRRQA